MRAIFHHVTSVAFAIVVRQVFVPLSGQFIVQEGIDLVDLGLIGGDTSSPAQPWRSCAVPGSMSEASEPMEVNGCALAEVVKPSIDELEYRQLQLPNGIKVLLISDKDTDKAAAAMDVRVGSMSDPAELPGLAHFLEHMLFYASKKYPTEDEYSKFISDHGGHTNAYTAPESTNYHFDCNADALEDALDRFAQFFICPLINKDGVEREVQAVDSEHGKNLNSDPWKKLQLWKATSNASHPFCKFSTGNLETLLTGPKGRGVDTHEEVRKFYERHYSANLMRLVVYGKQPLEELQSLVQDKFAQVPNQDLEPAIISDDVVLAEHTSRLIRMVPEKEGHAVEVQWAVPPEWRDWRSGPCSYVGRLLGDEGDGSAFALLKARGWATSLVAGESGNSFSSRSFFMVRVELTDEGHMQVKQVLSVIFQYVRLALGDGGISQQLFDEHCSLQRMRFDFRDKSPPFSYSQTLAHSMQLYGGEELLLAVYGVPQVYKPEKVRQVLERMTPSNARVMWASKLLQHEAPLREAVYGTPFSNEPLPEEWLRAWAEDEVSGGLALPTPNPFIPTDFALAQDSSITPPQPERIYRSKRSTLWYKPDTSFRTPKAVMYVDVALAESYSTPEAAVMTRLTSKLLGDYLSELTYPAELAGLYYGVSTTTSGLTLWLGGYNHRLPQLLEAVLTPLAQFTVQPDRFADQREQLEKEYVNMMYNQPYQHAFYAASMLLEHRRWHVDEYKQVVGGITHQQLQDFFPRLWSRSSITAYVAGNVKQEVAVALTKQVEALLDGPLASGCLFDSQLPERRVVKLPEGVHVLYSQPGPNPANENSAVVLLYQVGPDDLPRNALAELFVHVAKRDTFHTLRTVEQLGYIVSVYYYSVLSVRSVSFILQSTVYEASHLDSRVEAFLGGLKERFETLTDEEFEQQVGELAKAKLDKPKSVRQAAARDWAEIQEGNLVFGRQQREVDTLRELTRMQLQQFAQEFVFDHARRRKLSIHVRGANDKAGVQQEQQQPRGVHGKQEQEVVVEDIWAFKRRCEAYPSPL